MAREALPVLETARLRLRQRTLADLEDCFRMDREPGTLDFIEWPGKTADWSDDAAHRAHIRARTLHPYPPGMGYWCVTPADSSGTFLGWVMLIPEDTHGPEIEIGWRLLRAARGRGHATEAAAALARHGFAALGLERIVAEMHRANRPSMGVARKLGFRQADDPARTKADHVLWVLDHADWQAMNR